LPTHCSRVGEKLTPSVSSRQETIGLIKIEATAELSVRIPDRPTFNHRAIVAFAVENLVRA
jgi:hypothetical protein